MFFQSETITVEKDRDGSAFLKIDVPGQTHNVITRQVLADLDAAFDAVAAEAGLPLLVVRSGKPAGFLAGADLHGFLEIADAAAAEALSAQGQRLFDKLAALSMPTLAAIHGPCLGGGLELALACDYRLVLDRPNTQLGLPEVRLGLLPGWGGTQRLPRVVGLRRALEMILQGKRLGAREALKAGLADVAPVSEADLRSQLAFLGISAIKRGKRPLKGLPLRTWGQRLLESTALGRAVLFGATERALRGVVPDDMPAPAEALQAVRVGLKEGMAAGLAQERGAAGRLAVSPACRNLVALWLRGEKAQKMPEALVAVAPAEVRRVGVVGAGVMGAGIAQLAAVRGASKVVVREINQAALDAGLARIQDLFDKDGRAARAVGGRGRETLRRRARHHGLGRLRGRGRRRRSGRRKPRRQAGRLPRLGRPDAAGRRAGDQHVVALGGIAGRRLEAPRARRRDALLQPRPPDATCRGRADPGDQ